jgi:ABC-type branched-subunit amino acid transport system substrate-binding protein
LGPDAFDDQKVLKIAGSAAEGLIFSTVKPRAGSLSSAFEETYKMKYRRDPPYLADYGYDTLRLIIAAVEHQKLTGDEIKNFLYSLQSFPGAANNITFDERGDLVSPTLTFKTIKNAEF